MIHPYDEESLKRMLAVAQLPRAVVDECYLWTQMYHRDGSTGRLGGVALIAMLRGMGISPPAQKTGDERIDWRKYPQDGSTRVLAIVKNSWQPGVFRGFVANGTLAVKLDSSAFIVELPPSSVKLAPDATDNLSVEPEDEIVPDPPVKSQRATKKSPEKKAAEKPVEPAVSGLVDWSLVADGTQVWVQTDDDYLEAAFIRMAGENATEVMVDILDVVAGGSGEKYRIVPTSSVQLR